MEVGGECEVRALMVGVRPRVWKATAMLAFQARQVLWLVRRGCRVGDRHDGLSLDVVGCCFVAKSTFDVGNEG